uniref:Uncharacterized protein n=1 Tax=Rhizophora mucronata TaxID=61149 RepID=A0A2P2N837_RHIMU
MFLPVGMLSKSKDTDLLEHFYLSHLQCWLPWTNHGATVRLFSYDIEVMDSSLRNNLFLKEHISSPFPDTTELEFHALGHSLMSQFP